MISLNTSMQRLSDAVATASSGYTGVPGTEFEVAVGGVSNPNITNNFGVQPDPANPGARGTDYAYAINQLNTQWIAFWAAAEAFIEQLDNGTGTP